MSITALESLSSLPFHTYLSLALANSSLSPSTEINVGQPAHMKHLGALLRRTPISTLRDVMGWTALLSFATDLPSAFGREYFRFFGKTLSGTPKQSPRWKRCQAKAIGWMVNGSTQLASSPALQQLSSLELSILLTSAHLRRLLVFPRRLLLFVC
jgi:predicted metalloendopeptidase